MSRFDFTPYRRSTVGFDRLFDLLESQARVSGGDNYPPFNIQKQGEDNYRITLAVAGFKPADIDITAQQNLLVVQGKKRDESDGDGEMLHLGIANRGFERRFELADFVRVENARLEDGLLNIDLVREVPEAMKPKKITVNGQANLGIVRTDDDHTQIEQSPIKKGGANAA
jgi:molecular chaperone IbpA